MRWLVAWVATLGLLAFARPARAAMMTHTDLASLALHSQVVVVAQRSPTATTSGYVTARDYRVVEVVHGTGLNVGEIVTIDDGIYRTSDWGEPPPATIGDEAVLFLAPASPAGTWQLVPSGLRLVIAGGVHRFEQGSNPGPYEAVPQGVDPEDVQGLPGPKGPLSMADFRRELDEAVRRAEQARSWLDAPAGRQRDEALWTLVGPEVSQVHVFRESTIGSFYVDRLASAILESLGEENLDAFLEAEARARHLGWADQLTVRHDADALMAVAETKGAPLARRAAALSLAGSFFARGGTDMEARVIALMGHAEPALRAAAVSNDRLQRATSNEAKAALRSLWVAEQDPRVRVIIVEAAARWNISLGEDVFEVAAERQGPRIVHRSAWTGNRPPLDHMTLVIDDGESERRVRIEGPAWSTTHSSGGAWWIPKDLVALGGKWTLEIKRSDETSPRRLPLWSPLGAVVTDTPPAHGAEDTKVVASPPPLPPAPTAACGCAVPGPAAPSCGWLALALCGALALCRSLSRPTGSAAEALPPRVARRRRRPRGPSHGGSSPDPR
jgi:hypothetical protein